MASPVPPSSTACPPAPGVYECQSSTEYTPWAPVFQARYLAALQGLVAHLQGEGVQVVGLGLSGINHLTAEFHMESQTKSKGGCVGTNATVLWQGLGYTSTLMEGAASAIYNGTSQAFPGLGLSFPFVASNELPGIGPKGKSAGAAKVAGYFATVLAGAQSLGAATQWNGLATGAANPPQWQSGGALQTTTYLAGQPGNPCSPATAEVACNDAVFGTELQGAIADGASRIEVWAGDFEYEDQILAANTALLGQ